MWEEPLNVVSVDLFAISGNKEVLVMDYRNGKQNGGVEIGLDSCLVKQFQCWELECVEALFYFIFLSSIL